MDVKIAYGIDLGSVPDRVVEMLKNIETTPIEQLIHVAYEVLEISNDNAGIALNLLDQARLKMSSVDRSINDCHMILQGYVGTVKKMEEPSTPMTPEPVSTPESSDVD